MAVDGAERPAVAQHVLDGQAVRVGDGAVDVRDPDHLDPRLVEEPRGRPTHRPEALYDGGGGGPGCPVPVEDREGGLRDPAAADEVRESDAVHLDRERFVEPFPRGLRVVEGPHHRGDAAVHPQLTEHLVDELRRRAEIVARRPVSVHVRADEGQEAGEHTACLAAERVAVDPALGAAHGQIAVRGVVVQRLLDAHRLRQFPDLLQAAALAHAQPSAGEAPDQPVDDEEALASGDGVGPGEGGFRAAGRGAMRRGPRAG